MTIAIEPAAPKPVADGRQFSDRIDQLVMRLLSEYGQRVGERIVLEQVNEATEAMGDARLPNYVPIFVERDARRRIREYLAGRSDSGTV